MNKRIICDSGLEGWQGKLQDQYDSFRSFQQYDDLYDLAGQLGFTTSREAWAANPTIQGSTIPSDYRVSS